MNAHISGEKKERELNECIVGSINDGTKGMETKKKKKEINVNNINGTLDWMCACGLIKCIVAFLFLWRQTWPQIHSSMPSNHKLISVATGQLTTRYSVLDIFNFIDDKIEEKKKIYKKN